MLINVCEAASRGELDVSYAAVTAGNEVLSACRHRTAYDMVTGAAGYPEGKPRVVTSIDRFKSRLDTITLGVLSNVDWENLLLAGGGALACASQVPSGVETNAWLHHTRAARDVDLFIHGLEPEAAHRKLAQVLQMIAQVRNDTVVIRSENAVTVRLLHATEPPRLQAQHSSQRASVLKPVLQSEAAAPSFAAIQIILRCHESAEAVLQCFDIDACCIGYDGQNVLCLPRTKDALISGMNVTDMMQRSATYETRLLKYAARGFAVVVPELKRQCLAKELSAPQAPTADCVWITKGLRKLLQAENHIRHMGQFPFPTWKQGQRHVQAREVLTETKEVREEQHEGDSGEWTSKVPGYLRRHLLQVVGSIRT